MASPPVDSFHRRIDYLRLSITDRCNLRCVYCVPKEGIPRLSHHDVLSYEEILRLANLIVGMGISKIRITGGEPLVRRDVVSLCQSIARLPGLGDLTLTTNGILLEQYAEALKNAGIRRVNVSLDTLQSDKFELITRRGHLEQVWRGVMAAQKAGLSPIKLNMVVMRGVNDDEIEDMALLTRQHPFHVRFIEFMPFSSDDSSSGFISSEEILARLKKIAHLSPTESKNSNGPAKHYRFADAPGKLGIISPISDHFCPACNRLRLTADGKLRTCLFSQDETDLRTLLRGGASDEEVVGEIRRAIGSKPEKHLLEPGALRKCISRPMVRIGG